MQPITASGASYLSGGWTRTGDRHGCPRRRRLASVDAVSAAPEHRKALPAADLIQRGIADLSAERETAEALLVSIGATRLRSVGMELPSPIEAPEHKLYLLLGREKGDAAHSAYNALVRRLVSFERAAQCAS